MICRDIWTLYLCLLPSPPPPEPLLYEQDIEGNNHREDSNARRTHSAETNTSTAGDHQDGGTKKKPSDESDAESDSRSNKASSSDSDSGSDPESNDNDDDDDDADDKHHKNIMDEEMASLLRGLSDSEPDSDDELETDPNAHAGQGDEHDDSKGKKRQGHRGGRYESPTCTLAVLLVACWTIRVPVAIMDFIRWVSLTLLPFLPGYFCGIRSPSLTFRVFMPLSISDWPTNRPPDSPADDGCYTPSLIDSYTLPYLDPTNHLPPEMTHHLNKHALQAISPPVSSSFPMCSFLFYTPLYPSSPYFAAPRNISSFQFHGHVRLSLSPCTKIGAS